MKLCKKCEIKKEFTEFYKRKGNNDGYSKFCKNCIDESYIVVNEKICSKCKQIKGINLFYKSNRYKDGLSSVCKECDKSVKRNKKESDAKYYEKNKIELNNKYKENRENNNELVNKKQRDYYSRNNDRINSNRRRYKKERRKNDINFKLKYDISNLIRFSLKNKKFSKKSRTYEILGCSYDDFRNYIENQFEYWMNWNNHSIYTGNYNETWQLDHIIPINLAITEYDILKLNHYTNFRPLCSRKNLEKSNHIL